MTTMKLSAAIIIPVLILGGCAHLQRAETASQAQTQLIGMTKKEIYLCAGVPVRQEAVEGMEFLTYASGGDTTAVGIGTAAAQNSGVAVASSRRRYCEVTFVFSDGVVQKINYQGRTGGPVSKGEQCAFVVEPCMKQ